MKAYDRKKACKKRHARIRMKVFGTAERPRLAVYRSLKNIEGQIIDDQQERTILGISTFSKEVKKDGLEKKTKVELSKLLGQTLGRQAVEKGIEQVVFDRGGYLYHGRVKAFAEGAREGGLKF